MRAYSETYLDDAMENMAEAVDLAVNGYGLTLSEFFGLFEASGIAAQFGKGSPKYVSGLSGTELVKDVFAKVGLSVKAGKAPAGYDCSPEYWCGWILARFQWESGHSFKKIFEKIDGDLLLKMYPTLHEAPEEKSIEMLFEKMKAGSESSNLQRIRHYYGCSQSELAAKSDINLRTLQQYESRAKNINKAAASSLEALANALGCRPEDLMEI